MNILCIGNSFSQDACEHLHNIAEFSGKDVFTLNLYISGCSLETHAYNIFFNKPKYMFQYNGIVNDDCRYGTIQEALTERDWDYISIQQASPTCGKYETYQPHLNRIIARVRDVCPNSKIIVHQTWSYDPLSPRFPKYYENCNQMYDSLIDAYNKAAHAVNAHTIIPSGEVIQALRYEAPFDVENGGISLHRDYHHLSYEYGCYAAGATWYQMLVDDINNNGYIPPFDNIDLKLVELIKQTVTKICK